MPIKAPVNPLIINPKITNEAEDLIFEAKLKISNNAKNEPTNEAKIISQGLFKYISNPKIEKRKITTPTPKLAIDVTPKTEGSANGFLNNSCIMKPEIGKAMPTKTAAIDFGNLKFKIKFWWTSVEELNTEKISLIGIATLPTVRLTKKSKIAKQQIVIKSPF